MAEAVEKEKKEQKEKKTEGQDAQQEDRNLELLLNIPLEVTVELGKAKMLLKDLLNLADLVKFARARPDDEMCSRAVDGTLQIIAATTVNPAEGERQ